MFCTYVPYSNNVSQDGYSVHMYHTATMFPQDVCSVHMYHTATMFPRCMFCTHIPYSNNVSKMYVLYTYTIQQQCSQDVCSVQMYHTATIKRKQTRKQTIFLSVLLFSQKYFRIQYSVKKICGFPSAYQPLVGLANPYM